MYINSEETGLKISLGGGLLFAILGIGIAFRSRSQLVLADGSYSLLDSLFTYLILKITLLIGENNSKKIKLECIKEYFLILRSMIILFFLSFLFVNNIKAIFNGGRTIDIESVGIYTLISIVGGFIFIYLLSRCKKSRVIKLEYKSWLIDTLLSSIIALTVIISFFLKDGPFSTLRFYIEPILIIVIVILNIPYPLQLIKKSCIKIRNYR